MSRDPEPLPRGRRARARMTASQRREQLVDVGRKLFAEKGFDGASVEEIAHRAAVSKPVVYEHFGGKEGLYAVVVDREISSLLTSIIDALATTDHPRMLAERAALALLDYIEASPDGFRILVRDSPVGGSGSSLASLMSDVASQVEHLLAASFKRNGFDAKLAPMYSQMLVGMVALTGQWWMDSRKPKKQEVAAHLVNLAWNGLSGLQAKPTLLETKTKKSSRSRPSGVRSVPPAPVPLVVVQGELAEELATPLRMDAIPSVDAGS